MAASKPTFWDARPVHRRLDPPVSDSRELSEILLDARLLQPPPIPGPLAAIDRFQIIRELGSGGMGVVLLARDPQHAIPGSSSGGDLVALKLLRPELVGHPRSIERFLGEANHMRLFRHAHILPILEVGASRRCPYLVMPHLARGSLARYLREHGPMRELPAVRISLEIASALQHAHARGIIHRDLKPANVLLDDQGSAVLTDFGLARTLLNEGVLDLDRDHREGTAPYMSPAVARGEAEDTRCDIYAFGALLYEVLTGRPPYRGATSAEITRKIIAAPPTPVLSVRPSASAPLARIAEWAMARELRQRYAHILDVVHDLQRVQSGLDPLGPHGHRSLSALPPLSLQRPRISLLLMGTLTAALLVVPSLIVTVPGLARRSFNGRPQEFRLTPVDPTLPPAQVPRGPSSAPAGWFLIRDCQVLMLGDQPHPPAGSGPVLPTTPHLQVLRVFPLPTDRPGSDGSPQPLERAVVDLLLNRPADAPNRRLVIRAGTKQGARFTHLCCYDFESAALLWMREEPGGFIASQVAQPHGGSSQELVTLIGAMGLSPARVQWIDPSGRLGHAAPLPRTPASLQIAGTHGATPLKVLVLDEGAWLHEFDETLHTRRSVFLGHLAPSGSRLHLHAVADLDQDHRPEWILSTSPVDAQRQDDLTARFAAHPELLVIDPNLHLMARQSIAEDDPNGGPANVQVSDVTGDDRPEILWQGTHRLVLKVEASSP